MTERGKHHTIEEWLAQPSERRLELIDGEFIEKAAPDFVHGVSQASVVGSLSPLFLGNGGGAGSGWWIASEVDIQLGTNGYRPDVAGWRRSRLAEPPAVRPVTVRPDWLCEVLSESNRNNDVIRKLRRYHEAGVPHYWLLDPESGTLTVFRHQPLGYMSVLVADRHQRVRAEPFEELELHISVLLGGSSQ